VTPAGVCAGGAAWLAGRPDIAHVAWAASTSIALLLAGGQALEEFAAVLARRELSWCIALKTAS
jgi:hypothetical protein